MQKKKNTTTHPKILLSNAVGVMPFLGQLSLEPHNMNSYLSDLCVTGALRGNWLNRIKYQVDSAWLGDLHFDLKYL